ncbi:hypothetical protein HID58_033555 [Brassica napus]|uniref:Cystatin domain-containing protein n=1 Tax=Brassica napus TaxID=3708 RepID=A0ABQ8BZK7_BRANA|nr:hypothetical protein HID58_033555 [Brassica napus]
MNSRAIFLLLLSFHASAMLPAGRWSPISNVNDPHVVEVGKFAVSEYDMESKSELKFVAVVSGESKVVAGTNYRLIVAVNDGVAGPGASKNYEAIVWEKQCVRTPLKPALFKRMGGKEERVRIGSCVSTRGGAGRDASSAARRLPSQHLTSSSYAGDPPGLFKSKPRTPVDLVRQTRDLLLYADRSNSSSLPDSKRHEKMAELSRNIRDIKFILYGNSEAEPVAEACAQLTQEFFRQDTLRLFITSLPILNLETRKDATQVVANLQRQQVNYKLIASDYLEANLDLMDVLILGFENLDMALHYGAMFRECIRHQIVAKYVLESEHVKKFFDYIQLANFDIAADAAATFKELLTRHKSTVADFLTNNEEWFFADYNSKLLESVNYVTRRQAIKESSKSIQIEAFHVFKLFVANQNKPAEIVNIMVTNRSKLLRLLADLRPDKEDERFEADKSQVLREISSLEPLVLA